MRLIFCLVLALAVLQVPALAQTPDTFVAFSYTSMQLPVLLYQVSSQGAVLATLANLPAGNIPQGIVVAEDNKSYRAVGYQYSAPSYTGVIFDVAPGGIVKTLVSGPPLVRPTIMVRTCDGEWLVVNQGTTTTSFDLYRLQGTQLTLLSTVQNLYAYYLALTTDEDSGQLVGRSMTLSTPRKYGYFRIDPATGTVTDFALYKQGVTTLIYYGSREPFFEGTTGAVLDMSYDSTQQGSKIFRVHPETGIMPISPSAIPAIPIDMTLAGQRTTGVRYYVLGRTLTSPYTYQIVRVKSDGTAAGASSILGFTPYLRSTLLRVGSRNLTWFMDTPPNGRSLRLSYPGEGGRQYRVAFSLAGVRPGPLLSDRREIPLIPDELTLLCLNGGVQGILENTTGFLNASGEASVKVDTNVLGSALKDVKMWAVALVLDPGASAGISHISGPILLHIKQ